MHSLCKCTSCGNYFYMNILKENRFVCLGHPVRYKHFYGKWSSVLKHDTTYYKPEISNTKKKLIYFLCNFTFAFVSLNYCLGRHLIECAQEIQGISLAFVLSLSAPAEQNAGWFFTNYLKTCYYLLIISFHFKWVNRLWYPYG